MAHQIDQQVGAQIRSRRWTLGLTQQQLAEQIGVRYQQVQKYETGANQITVGRLHDIALALDVPMQFFFQGLGQDN